MDIRKTIALLAFLLPVFFLLSGNRAFAEAGEPAYTCTRIDLPLRSVADFFVESMQGVSGDLSFSPKNFLDALQKDGKFRELSKRLKGLGDGGRVQKWLDRFRDLAGTLAPEGGKLRLTLRRLKPKTYRDEKGLHFIFALDFEALRHPEGGSAADDFVLHVLLKAGEGEDWAARLTPSAYVEWQGRGRTFELPEGALLDKIRKHAQAAETLLNGQLDLGALKRHIPFRDETASDDAKPEALTRRALDPMIRRLWGAMLAGSPEAYRIEYETPDAHGKTIAVSGVIVFPLTLSADLSRIPVLAVQHPTLVERRYAPSEFSTGLKESVPSQFFAYLALMAAANGYMVVAGDYPGLGVSTDPHPFCHASLAGSVVDALRVARAVLNEKLKPQGKSWEGKLYLIGYSEGGYASMVAARRLQETVSEDLMPSGVACLSGPYSLSEAMRAEMTAPVRNYPTPYLLPMLLSAYDAIYPGAGFAFDAAIRRDVPGFPNYPEALRSLIDGVRTEAEINGLIGEVPDYAEKGPMALMTPDFLERLGDPDSAIVRLLAENDAYRGWVPAMPMKLIHNTKDATVPAANATTAFVAFEAAGSTTVKMELFDDVVPATGNVHLDASAPSFLKGMLWLRTLRETEEK